MKFLQSKKFKGILSIILTISVVTCSAGCGKKKKDTTTYYDNESDPLVFSSQEVDKVFNPFFSTSAVDSNVVGLTQIGMITNDKEGNPVCGDDYEVVTKEYQTITTGSGDDATTEYLFVLKNNVRFSNGSYLTMKDVFFNLYVYLDPVYSGSSTIYSTDIVGLKEYRTQATSEKEQDAFALRFLDEANDRVDALVFAYQEIDEANDDAVSSGTMSSSEFRTELENYTIANQGEVYSHLAEDYDEALSLFQKELETDYSNSMDSYEDMSFFDEDKIEYKGLFTTDVEVFLYNEGYISWNKKEGKLTSSLTNNLSELKSYTREQAVKLVYEDNIPTHIDQVIRYWATSAELVSYLTNASMEDFYKGQTIDYDYISGIKFANRTESVIVNGHNYSAPTYNADGSVKSGNEVLSITINGVDPKAIWNFSFAVAPMYYYSDQAHIDAFSFEDHKFGVEYGSQTFMNNVVKNSEKIGVPVGAGPYAASKSSGGITNVSKGDFYSKGIIYFERNPYYNMGSGVNGVARIKKIRYKIVPTAQLINSLLEDEIDFIEPNAKPETILQLDGYAKQGIGNKSIRTAGYGYIGINAGKVPSVYVRRAIMYAINTQDCVNYYGTTAEPIYRSLSKANWAYPKDSTPYYPYIKGKVPANLDVVDSFYADYVEECGLNAGDTFSEAQIKEFFRRLIEDEANYTLNGNGIYQNGKDILKYTFTIAGETDDHPAFNAMNNAKELLNRYGFAINVTTDANALKKLSNGDLTVWAAAWGSTIDPDMYQVYHRDSKATSVLNWGYKQILNDTSGKYSYEKGIIDDMSELIDDARKTNEQNERILLYKDALDYVMELAVELPTYQRQDLFAYNKNKIDVSTFTSERELSPYKGLTYSLSSVSLNVEK